MPGGAKVSVETGKKKSIFPFLPCVTHLCAENCPSLLQLLFYSEPVPLLIVGARLLAPDLLLPEQTKSPTRSVNLP